MQNMKSMKEQMDVVDVNSPEFIDAVQRLRKKGEESSYNTRITEHMPMTPKQFVHLINEIYLDARKSKLSRMDPRWGVWSEKMNEELRDRIKANDPEALKLKYVIVYWTLMSQLLELHFKSPHFGENKKKQVLKESQKIKKIILSADGLNVPELEKDDVMNMVLRGFKK